MADLAMNEILLGILGTLVTALIYVVKSTMTKSDSLIASRDKILNRTLTVLERSVAASEEFHRQLIKKLDQLVDHQEDIRKKLSA